MSYERPPDNEDSRRRLVAERHVELASRWADLYEDGFNPSASIVLRSPIYFLRHSDTWNLPLSLKRNWDELVSNSHEVVLQFAGEEVLSQQIARPDRSKNEQASQIIEGLERLISEGKIPKENRHNVAYILRLSALVFGESLQYSPGLDLNYFIEKTQDSERMLPPSNSEA